MENNLYLGKSKLNMLGDTYKNSGKVHWGQYLLSTLTGLVISAIVGMVYGFVSNWNPFIYVNFIVLAIGVYIVTLVNTLVTTWGKSRNRVANAVSGLVLGFGASVGSWFILIPDIPWINIINLPYLWEVVTYTIEHNEISIGRFGTGGIQITGIGLAIIYLLEFLAFLSPAVFAYMAVNVYCEQCDQPTELRTYYIPFSKEIRNALTSVKGGYYNKALSEIPLDEAMNYGSGTTLIRIEDHQCKKCNNFRVLNIDEGVVKTEDDGKKEFKPKVSFVKNMIVEPEVVSLSDKEVE